tara:strand:- start:12993 stop:13832 length:840 start_codon:yes stop_codon:yes gene_type:complete
MTVVFKTNPEMQAGTLSDVQLNNACKEGWLITSDFDENSVKQACYELRAGNIYYELDRVTADQTPERQQLKEGEFILLKPKQVIVIITMESLQLPNNVIGRVLTKGKLLSIGVSAVNTYADPGFKGRLGIVLANHSNNYIRIDQQQPISKIEFSKLRCSVQSQYSGQHGYESEIWPVPYEQVLKRSAIKNDPRVRSDFEELEASHGPLIADISRRMFRYERRLLFSGVTYFTFMGMLIAWWTATENTAPLSNAVAITTGVTANLVTGFLTFFATKLGNR